MIPDDPQGEETPAIDWEQRWYEIAKDVMAGLASAEGKSYSDMRNMPYYDMARKAVLCAYELIKQLKAQ